MENLLNLLIVLGVIGFWVGVIMLFMKSRRKRGLKWLGVSFVLVCTFAFIQQDQLNKAARELGFKDAKEQASAQKSGYDNAEEYYAYRSQLLIDVRAKHAEEATKRAEQERLAQEQAAQAEAKAEKERAAKTMQMMKDVAEFFKNEFEIDIVTNSVDGSLCREDGYCDGMIGAYRLQIWGKGVVELSTSTQRPHDEYRTICAMVFAGIANINPDLANEIIEPTF